MRDIGVQKLFGLPALWYTLQYLYVHFLICVSIAALAVALHWTKSQKPRPGFSDCFGKFVSSLTFASLGFVMAYVLSLGMNHNGDASSILMTVSTGLIPIIAGGITYAETVQNSPQPPRTAVLGFLLSFVLCSHTFQTQLSYHWLV